MKSFLFNILFLCLVIIDGSTGFLSLRKSCNTCFSNHKLTPTQNYDSIHEIAVDASTVLEKSILFRLNDLINKRSKARWIGNYIEADTIRFEIKEFEKENIPEFLHIVITDNPRSMGGNSSWTLMYDIDEAIIKSKSTGVLQLAHASLGMASTYSKKGLVLPPDKLEYFVLQAKNLLQSWKSVNDKIECSSNDNKSGISFNALKEIVGNFRTPSIDVMNWNAVRNDLSGRKAADAAFYFSLTGTTDKELFHQLTQICVTELQRFGERKSCRAKDILCIVERLAAAGVTHEENKQLVEIITRSLQSKGQAQETKLLIDPNNYFDLHSNYTALTIWKQSFLMRTSLRSGNELDVDIVDDEICETKEIHNSVGSEPTKIDWFNIFADPKKPIVIDLGCGMGISLLGLATLANNTSSIWSNYNYVGVDLSSLTINYAKGIAERWKIEGQVSFFVDRADYFLEKIKSYPGSVKLILIQFPTPYRLPKSSTMNFIEASPVGEKKGNSRLPSSVNDGFMVTADLLNIIAELLRESNGELVIQSNCEDVAVWMRQTACDQVGFNYRQSDTVVSSAESPTKRTLAWIEMGGRRAIGLGWSPLPILPPTGRTETEIACILNDTPVHRCVLVPKIS